MKLTVLTLFSFVVVVISRKLPSFVKTCHRNDPKIGDCVMDSVKSLLPYLMKGIPEMGIPSVDPLRISALYLDSGNGTNFGYTVNFTDLNFFGGKDMRVEKATIDVQKGIFYMNLVVPEFYVIGKYTSRGKILLIELQGDGDMTSNFTNVEIDGKWEAKKYTKNGKEHYNFDKNQVEINIGPIATDFKNLFKGNPELTANTNKIFNENSDILYEEIKPVVSNGISKIITGVLNTVHERFSNDDLYPI